MGGDSNPSTLILPNLLIKKEHNMGNYAATSILGSTITGSTDSEVIGIHHSDKLCVQLSWTNDTPSSAETGSTGKVEVQTVTFAAGASTASGDYFALTDTAGLKWAVAIQKKNVETITFPAKSAAASGDHVIVYDTSEVAWGISLDKTGSADEPTSALWLAIPAAKKVHVDISAATTAAEVAAAVEAAVDALTGFSTVIVTDDSAADGTMTFTQASIGAITPAIPLSPSGAAAGAISPATTVLGRDEPTGAIWAAIPATRKAQATVAANATNAQVASAVETVFDALTAVPFTSTVSTNTILFTNTVRGNTIDGAVKTHNDGGAGSISVANTTQGVNSIVNVANNTITLAAHGYTTGLKGQIAIDAGSLPTGLSGSTDYFVIVVDANTVKLAASLADALAGTAIDIEDQGTADKTLTFTPTSIAGGVVHLEGSNDRATWFDITNMTANITATGSAVWHVTDAAYIFTRVNATLTAGQITIAGVIAQKGPSTR